jgi:hypothetical protein
MKTIKSQAIKHATGTDRAYLEKLIPSLELRSEALRRDGKIVSAGELMQATRYLRQLCPPTSRVHDRGWNNGDLFPVDAAS